MHPEKKTALASLLIGAFLLIVTLCCLAAVFLPLSPGQRQENYIADIYQNGELILSIPLDPAAHLTSGADLSSEDGLSLDSAAVLHSAAALDSITDLTLLPGQFGQEMPAGWAFTIQGENQCFNRIEIRGDSIGITQADCPDKICIHQGFIRTAQLPITCLPNRLVIQLRSASLQALEDPSSSQEVDMISYM